MIASSYNEPLITSEWAVAIFKLAQAAGMKCVYVSNGNATPEVLDYLRPYLAGMKIDLKSMQDKNYRQLGGVLQKCPGHHPPGAPDGLVDGGGDPGHPGLQ